MKKGSLRAHLRKIAPKGGTAVMSKPGHAKKLAKKRWKLQRAKDKKKGA